MNKKYYWLKLKNDFFTDKRIKKLRKIAGGDTYTIIYLKMQLLSLKHDGCLFFDGVEETFEEEIALEIDEDVEDVKITVGFLLNNNLLEQKNVDEYELIETKNCIGSETQVAERVRNYRKKQKMLQCNTNVTKSNIEIDIEKDKDIEIEKEQENIFEFVEKNFNRTLSPIEYEVIQTWEDTELTRYAIKIAVLNGVYKINYIDKILFNWQKQNITSVQQAQSATQRTQTGHNEPDWFNNEQQIESTSDQEQKEMEELLKELENE